MGFTKRYCYKDSIVRAKDFEDVLKMTHADAVFFDGWTGEFFRNFNFDIEKYESLRLSLLEESLQLKAKYESGPFSKYSNYNELKCLGNIYIHLKKDPTWLDIELALEIMDIEVPNNYMNKNESLAKFCIGEIERYFTKHGRNDIIDKITK